MTSTCSFCKGSGVVHGEQCVACAGRGAPETDLSRLAAENTRLREALFRACRLADGLAELLHDRMSQEWDFGQDPDTERK